MIKPNSSWVQNVFESRHYANNSSEEISKKYKWYIRSSKYRATRSIRAYSFFPSGGPSEYFYGKWCPLVGTYEKGYVNSSLFRYIFTWLWWKLPSKLLSFWFKVALLTLLSPTLNFTNFSDEDIEWKSQVSALMKCKFPMKIISSV